ncbi:TIGR04222 domain-containing membrane protein [Parerythrobacter lacustris]|uniref:TIGR04222 domain-containing membrane protein n=1 Tax=Parerythrobacter lacustris TaxID=2969984 RepID=A0ABT1XSH6_9SPHN|nr:TIGR04222 domain-containing membrane protein [Parerythrobacter lacustris]MCR2834605.1 TIGR04222 domain-containing membrane protein [Parerythrobacter lacustris]
MTLGLSALSGSTFLLLYIALLAAALGLSLMLGAWMRAEGDDAGTPSEEELAFLSGGKQRFTEAIIARLLAGGSIEVSGEKGFVVTRSDAGTTSAERAITRQAGIVTWQDAAKATAQDADSVLERLETKGWWMGDGAAWQVRLFQVLPFALLFALGLFRQQAGAAQGAPTGYLIGLLALTALIGLFRLFAVDRRTKAGKAVLGGAMQGNDRLRRAPQEHEMGSAVALFGTGVLVGTPFVAMHTMRQASSGDGGGSSDSSSSSDGGSGCGGGGCGGCGG